MKKTLEPYARQFQEEGARRHVSWNAALYQRLCDGPALAFWQALQKESREPASRKILLESYLRLLQEAVGRGYLKQAEGGSWTNLMELVLVQFVPEQLPLLKPQERLPELAKVWNLLEGLLGEPSWVNQFTLAHALKLKDLTALEQFLIDVLDPVLSPAPTAKWTGPFQQTVLDARAVDEEFLPGKMTLAAPWVLCVEDRRRPVRLGVLLQKEGKSEFIGPLPAMESIQEATALPTVRASRNKLHVNDQTFNVPLLNVADQIAVARAGFVVVSAVDSQRLWVVESA